MAIDRLQQIITQIRTSLGERVARGEDRARAPASTSGPGAPGDDVSTQELKAQVRAALRGVDAVGTGGHRRARRRFIEAALLAELGPSLADDPKFVEIVGEIEQTVSNDSALASQLDAVIADLHRTV